ncbi:type II toxin-antitoxin system VapC family toxin [Breznakiellaceae bacterium SP9]
MKIYLDNCCYNRPFDDLEQMAIKAETDSKLFIQMLITFGTIELVYSYILLHELEQIRLEDADKKENILSFINSIADRKYVGSDLETKVLEIGRGIMRTGVKYADAAHVACAILAKCDYFITTDKRLLKYQTDNIKLINPIDFEYRWRNEND